MENQFAQSHHYYKNGAHRHYTQGQILRYWHSMDMSPTTLLEPVRTTHAGTIMQYTVENASPSCPTMSWSLSSDRCTSTGFYFGRSVIAHHCISVLWAKKWKRGFFAHQTSSNARWCLVFTEVSSSNEEQYTECTGKVTRSSEFVDWNSSNGWLHECCRWNRCSGWIATSECRIASCSVTEQVADGMNDWGRWAS